MLYALYYCLCTVKFNVLVAVKLNSISILLFIPGFATAKGSLVRSILFPKPLDSKMWKDIMKFVITLVVLAALGFAYTIVILRLHHVSYKVYLYCLCDGANHLSSIILA